MANVDDIHGSAAATSLLPLQVWALKSYSKSVPVYVQALKVAALKALLGSLCSEFGDTASPRLTLAFPAPLSSAHTRRRRWGVLRPFWTSRRMWS